MALRTPEHCCMIQIWQEGPINSGSHGLALGSSELVKQVLRTQITMGLPNLPSGMSQAPVHGDETEKRAGRNDRTELITTITMAFVSRNAPNLFSFSMWITLEGVASSCAMNHLML